MRTPARTVLSTAVLTIAIAGLAGCSVSSSPSGAASDSGDGGSAAPAASSSAGAGAASGTTASGTKDACDLVTEAMLQVAYGFDPGSGTSRPGSGGAASTECDYGTKISVQVSGQPDLYMPKSIYGADAVGNGAVTPAGADYGYAAKDVVVVVKGSTGVLVAVTVAGTTADQGTALAAKIVGEL